MENGQNPIKYYFIMPYLGQFLFDFEKLGTVTTRKARSLIWVPKLSILNNIEKVKFLALTIYQGQNYYANDLDLSK